jgi:hypothetical protein
MSTPLRAVLLLLLTVIAVIYVGSFLYAVLVNYWPGPYNDYWVDISRVEQFFNQRLDLASLITAHNNAHRLLVPRILFIGDYLWFSGTNVLLVAVSVLCKVLTLMILNHVIRHQPLVLRLAANLMIIAAVFNSNNIHNIIYNSNIQWDLVTLFSLCSIYYYSRANDFTFQLRHREKHLSLALAYIFMWLGFFSHGGALSILFVFVLIPLFNKRYLTAVLTLAVLLIVLALNFIVLPISDPGEESFSEPWVVLVFKFVPTMMFVFKMLSASLHFYLGYWGLLFSLWLVVLFAGSLLMSRKTFGVCHNFFLHLAVFLFFMMVTMAAARVTFSFNHWWASRFMTTILMFLLAVNLHVLLALPAVWKSKAVSMQVIVVLVCLLQLALVQNYTYKDHFNLANKVFRTQANMFFKERTQYEAQGLITYYNESDRVASRDPFFREHHFGYYHNKQSDSQRLAELGERLADLSVNTLFKDSCQQVSDKVAYGSFVKKRTGERRQTIRVKLESLPLLKVVLNRNSYYLIDDAGVVSGFGYVHLGGSHGSFTKPELRGFVKERNIRYVAEVDDSGELACLFALR